MRIRFFRSTAIGALFATLGGCGSGAGATADGPANTDGGAAADGGAPVVANTPCEGGACGTQVSCATDHDCTLGVCVLGTCAEPTCTDTVKDGTETGVDCGGTCATKCANGGGCAIDADCANGVCQAGTCVPASCSDHAKDGVETDVDCGGSDGCNRCADTKACHVAADCMSSVCTGDVCQAATCADGAMNGTESDVDCGGACATKCADAKKCAVHADCASGECAASTHTCASVTALAITPGDGTTAQGVPGPTYVVTATYSDGAHRDVTGASGLHSDATGIATVDAAGHSTAVSSGTAHVDATLDGRTASVALTVLPVSCTDGAKNEDETDVDCGGGCSTKCADTKHCLVDADCASARCASNACVAVSGLTLDPGSPSVVDGATGPVYVVTAHYGDGATAAVTGSSGLHADDSAVVTIDGTSGASTTHGAGTTDVHATFDGHAADGTFTVIGATCSDGVRNGDETDADCGGGSCAKCVDAKHCLVGSDCVSDECTTSGHTCASVTGLAITTNPPGATSTPLGAPGPTYTVTATYSDGTHHTVNVVSGLHSTGTGVAVIADAAAGTSTPVDLGTTTVAASLDGASASVGLTVTAPDGVCWGWTALPRPTSTDAGGHAIDPTANACDIYDSSGHSAVSCSAGCFQPANPEPGASFSWTYCVETIAGHVWYCGT